ncbi:MAG TPA: pilus assembly protein N-terminal domain-containing protein, partial [Bradyrhizobium sp.]|uniref:pilus assembly protein N-terminal domain-containing protein n=1 Tax=Bradyrhizobium sp. TaxID=376 RepID=UPI002D7F8DE1
MARRGSRTSIRTQLIGALSASVAAFALTAGPTPAAAADGDTAPGPAIISVPPSATHTADPVTTASIPQKVRFLALGIGKSAIIDLPRDVKDVLVADPKIANAVIRSPQRAYVIGSAVGQTNVVFFDADGQQIAAYDIAIKRDLNGVRAALKQLLPGAAIQAEGIGDSVMLTGSVSTPIEAQQAGDVVSRLVGSPDKVLNSIVVKGRDQVMLKVTVAEVQRSIIKQLGIDLSASMNYGT